MSTATSEQYRPMPTAVRLLLTIVLPPAACGVAVLGMHNPLWAVAAIASIPLAYTMFRWPEVSTLVVLFILYTNAADVAVTFHGVPYLVAASSMLLLGIPLAYHVLVRRQELLLPRVWQLIVVFAVVQLVGAVTVATRPDASLLVARDTVFEGVVLYLLIINTIRSRETLRRSIWVLLVAGALLGSISLYQQLTHTFDNNYGGFAQMSAAAFETEGVGGISPDEQPRLAGPIGEQNRYAKILLMLVPLGLFRMWGEETRWRRLAAGALVVLITAGIVLTFSRQAAVGFAVMLLFMVAMRYISFRQLAITVLAVVPFLIAFPQYAMRVGSLQGVWSLVSGAGRHQVHEPDASIKGRTTEMLSAALAFADYPVIGLGPGMFKFHYQDYAYRIGLGHQHGRRNAHNAYLQIAAEEGTIGIICFLGILYLTLRGLFRARRRFLERDPELALITTSLILMVVTFAVTSAFGSFSYMRYNFLILALAGVVCIYGEKWLPPEERQEPSVEG